jgi:hypothetical protein
MCFCECSVGSLGKSKSRACVWGVRVDRAIFDHQRLSYQNVAGMDLIV